MGFQVETAIPGFMLVYRGWAIWRLALRLTAGGTWEQAELTSFFLFFPPILFCAARPKMGPHCCLSLRFKCVLPVRQYWHIGHAIFTRLPHFWESARNAGLTRPQPSSWPRQVQCPPTRLPLRLCRCCGVGVLVYLELIYDICWLIYGMTCLVFLYGIAWFICGMPPLIHAIADISSHMPPLKHASLIHVCCRVIDILCRVNAPESSIQPYLGLHTPDAIKKNLDCCTQVLFGWSQETLHPKRLGDTRVCPLQPLIESHVSDSQHITCEWMTCEWPDHNRVQGGLLQE